MSLPVARTVVVLVGAWFFLSWWVAAYHHQVHPDFDVHYLGGRVEREGGSYTDTRRLLAEAGPAHAAPTQGPIYGGPSLIALVFEPLSALPRQVAWHLFVVVCGAAMAVAIWRAAPSTPLAWLAPVALAHGTQYGWALGQPSLLTFALLVGAYGELRRGRDASAGLLVGIAAALKLYPAFLLVAFVAHGRWRACRWLLATMAVLFAATGLVLGAHGTALAIGRTLHAGGQVHPWAHNQSIPGVFLRVVRNQGLADLVAKVLTLAAGVWVLRHRRATPAVTYAWAALLMLLAQNITWEHYTPLAVLGLLAMAELGAGPRDWTLAGIGWALIALPIPYDRAPDARGWLALVTGPRMIGMVLVALALHRVTTPRPALVAEVAAS